MIDDPREWLAKADIDLDSARRSLADMPNKNRGAAAYSLQQAAEKLVKCILVKEGIPPRRRSGGHDIRLLVDALPTDHALRSKAESFAYLTVWATAFRYPAEDPVSVEPLPEEDRLKAVLEALRHFRNHTAEFIAVATIDYAAVDRSLVVLDDATSDRVAMDVLVRAILDIAQCRSEDIDESVVDALSIDRTVEELRGVLVAYATTETTLREIVLGDPDCSYRLLGPVR